MRRAGIIALAAAATVALTIAGCSNARRHEMTQSIPKRIVSLTPNNTEILFALGVGSRVVGVTNACNYPPEAKRLPKVGDVNISIEKVVALKPDLVDADKLLNDAAVKRL